MDLTMLGAAVEDINQHGEITHSRDVHGLGLGEAVGDAQGALISLLNGDGHPEALRRDLADRLADVIMEACGLGAHEGIDIEVAVTRRLAQLDGATVQSPSEPVAEYTGRRRRN